MAAQWLTRLAQGMAALTVEGHLLPAGEMGLGVATWRSACMSR
jgi:hypothetical protein